MTQSFSVAVYEVVCELGAATAPDVQARFPGSTRRQILDALARNRRQKRIELASRGQPMNNGASSFGMWVPTEKPETQRRRAALGIGRVNSVWGLASEPVRVLALPGRVCSPLGSWKD